MDNEFNRCWTFQAFRPKTNFQKDNLHQILNIFGSFWFFDSFCFEVKDCNVVFEKCNAKHVSSFMIKLEFLTREISKISHKLNEKRQNFENFHFSKFSGSVWGLFVCKRYLSLDKSLLDNKFRLVRQVNLSKPRSLLQNLTETETKLLKIGTFGSFTFWYQFETFSFAKLPSSRH